MRKSAHLVSPSTSWKVFAFFELLPTVVRAKCHGWEVVVGVCASGGVFGTAGRMDGPERAGLCFGWPCGSYRWDWWAGVSASEGEVVAEFGALVEELLVVRI